jgi:hypothetical protein
LYGNLGQVVFADNTAPNPTTPIQLFTESVNTDEVPPGALPPTPAFPGNTAAGYNFFMVAGDPFDTQLEIYYDPLNHLLSAQHVNADGSLTPVWERYNSYTMSASPALVPDRDLLYIDNYVNGHDNFVVLRLSTGEQLAVCVRRTTSLRQ